MFLDVFYTSFRCKTEKRIGPVGEPGPVLSMAWLASMSVTCIYSNFNKLYFDWQLIIPLINNKLR